jgi:hypothetical protein
MKRLSVFGLCIVASVVFSALVASSALAAKAEHGELYLLSSGGPAHLGTPHATITSTSNEGTAHINSATSGKATSNFKGVEIETTGLKCTSAGKGKGEVETKPLTEATGWISKAKNEAGVDFKAESGEFLAEFECEGGTKAKVRASVIGHVTPLNTMGLSTELNLIPEGVGKNNSPRSFEGGPTDVLESELSTAPGIFSESVQVQEHVTVTNHGNSSVCKVKKGVEKCKPLPAELNTVAAAQPEFGRCVKGGSKEFSDSNCMTRPEPGKKGKYGFNPVPS